MMEGTFDFDLQGLVAVQPVIPAKAGIQFSALDPRLRGDDSRGTERLQGVSVDLFGMKISLRRVR